MVGCPCCRPAARRAQLQARRRRALYRSGRCAEAAPPREPGRRSAEVSARTDEQQSPGAFRSGSGTRVPCVDVTEAARLLRGWDPAPVPWLILIATGALYIVAATRVTERCPSQPVEAVPDLVLRRPASPSRPSPWSGPPGAYDDVFFYAHMTQHILLEPCWPHHSWSSATRCCWCCVPAVPRARRRCGCRCLRSRVVTRS